MVDEKLPWFHPATAVLLTILSVVLLLIWLILPKSKSGVLERIKTSKESHVVITGGSSGIGLALARECLQQGFTHITLVARNTKKLQKAKEELAAVSSADQQIHIVSCDLTASRDAIQRIVKKEILSSIAPPPMVVFNNAGTAIAKSFLDCKDDFDFLLKTNYLGAVHFTQALVPTLQKNQGGILCYTSSMAGQLGVYGYTAYTPTKFALRGFCEALQMELRRDNIHVVLAVPPDTDTPGFVIENKDKPKETELISEAGGKMSADAYVFEKVHLEV